MNRYKEMKERHQREFNTFPKKFAFSDKQFEDGMKELGLTPNDTDKIYHVYGGGFFLKTDEPKFTEMTNRLNREMDEAIMADKTGEGFIYDMFKYELSNHEYGYTGDFEDTLDALDYTWEQIEADTRLKHGLEKAAKNIMKKETDW